MFLRIIGFLMLVVSIFSQSAEEIYIRVNTYAFLPGDIKTAVVLSGKDLEGLTYEISDTNGVVNKGRIGASLGNYSTLKFSYIIDFSKIKKNGKYNIRIEGKTISFNIAKEPGLQAAESALSFFRVQRCGYTGPIGHEVCHIADATELYLNGEKILQKKDLTGGWHDAADYVKFLNTTAFSTYMLLFSYEFNKSQAGFDKDGNMTADVLEEAKIGLDWLLRCNYDNKLLVTQVQDTRDHSGGWRLPEDDKFRFERPAFLGLGKNLIGIYAAVMAKASVIWREELNYPEFADKCLTAAENIYSLRNSAPDVDSSGSGHYLDKNYLSKMALGAAELYFATGREELLTEAMNYADKAGSDYWWSWGNVSSLSHYVLGKKNPKYAGYIKEELIHFQKNASGNVFEKASASTWGTTQLMLGICLKEILYEKLTGDKSFRRLSITQRDYVFGRNPWGLSFVSGFGKEYSKNLHHQIFKLKEDFSKGAVTAGPVPKKMLEPYGLFDADSGWNKFQTDDDYYSDSEDNYVTNEPTIGTNATAFFVFLNY